MTKKDNFDSLLFTRFKDRENLLNFFKMGKEAAPSIAGHIYHPESNNRAFSFGDYGLLATPDVANVNNSVIFPRDAATILSPELYKSPTDKGWMQLTDIYPASSIPVLKKFLKVDPYSMNEWDAAAMRPKWQGDFTPEEMRVLESFKKNGYNWGDILRKLKNDSSKVNNEIVGNIPLDRRSLEANIRSNTRLPYWADRTHQIGKPLDTMDAVRTMAARLKITDTPFYRALEKGEPLIRSAMKSAFNVPEGERDEAIDNFLMTGDVNKIDDDEETRLRRLMSSGNAAHKVNNVRGIKSEDLEDILNNINSLILDNKKQGSPIEKDASKKISKIGSPYLEVKSTDLWSPEDYAGIVYPETEGLQFTREDFRRKENEVNTAIKDIFKDKAIGYRRLPDEKKWKKQQNAEKMGALYKLALNLGVLKNG